MTGLRPRQLLHRGTMEAEGMIFDPELVPGPVLARRIFDSWSAGASLWRLPDRRWLLRWAQPRMISVPRAWGLPLTRQGGLLLAAPLSERELKGLGPLPANTVLEVRGGEVTPIAEEALRAEDPARWIDLGAVEVLEVAPLAVSRDPTLVTAVASTSLRERLAELPPENPETQRVLDALRAAARGEAQPEQGGQASGRWWSRLAGWLLRWLPQAKPSPSRPAAAEGQAWIGPQERPPGWGGRLRSFLARLALMTRLSSVIGERYARYLARTMEMFERGDLAAALRHAIPLDSGSTAKPGAAPPLLGPAPRSALTISPGRGGASSALMLSSSLFDELRRLYRAALQRLEREGKFAEAAFVLAELLNESEEAVSFLERHGRLDLAAELAEARQLAPGLVVRQWFLAGDVARAVRLARRHGAFADAVLRLERSHPAQALELRKQWAAVLAEAGDYVAAVEVIAPLEGAKVVVRPWLDRALEVGGRSGARALVRKLEWFPELFAEVRESALALLEAGGREQASDRASFAAALVQAKRSPAVAALAAPAFRAVLRDRALGYNAMSSAEVDTLAGVSGDLTLVADRPLLPPRAEPPKEIGPLKVTLAARDTGGLTIHDAVSLTGGRFLVALGEAGARLLTADGRTVAHFDVPAFSLVPSGAGDRALALAPRGTVQRISKIDLAARRCAFWLEARLDRWAADFDGSIWFASDGQAVIAVDALSPRYDALWRVDQIGGTVLALARDASSLAFLVGGEEIERWRFDLPSLTLRARARLAAIGDCAAIAPSGAAMIGNQERWRVDLYGPGTSAAFELLQTLPALERQAWFGPGWSAVGRKLPKGWVLELRVGEAQLVALLALEGAERVALRIADGVATVADDRGRLLRVELAWRALRVNLRL